MNEQNKTPHSVFGGLYAIADQMDPLEKEMNPALAAAVGFFTGGVGLAIMFKSWKDFLIPFGVLIFMMLVGIIFDEIPVVFTPVVWAMWAWRRVKSSNEKLLGSSRAPRIIEAEVITTPPPVPVTQIRLPDSRMPIQTRLLTLDAMLRDGILSQTERDERRARILAEI